MVSLPRRATTSTNPVSVSVFHPWVSSHRRKAGTTTSRSCHSTSAGQNAMRGIYPQATPRALSVEDVHEPVLYEHDLDGLLALVRESQDASADLASRATGRRLVPRGTYAAAHGA